MISGVFVLSTASQRSIHDYLAKTRVVGEDEKPVKRKEKKNKKNKKKK
ncbi:rDD family protein [Coprobacillus sp. CAG:235]|nr:rDD family protein [Coprobacillus sp. CAG:235]